MLPFLGYQFFDDPKTFRVASENCESNGGKLALPTREAANRDIVDLAKSHMGSTLLTPDEAPIWINVLLDSDNIPTQDLNYTNWKLNTPEDLDENCVTVDTRGSDAYKWDDEYCDMELPYICEFTGNVTMAKLLVEVLIVERERGLRELDVCL